MNIFDIYDYLNEQAKEKQYVVTPAAKQWQKEKERAERAELRRAELESIPRRLGCGYACAYYRSNYAERRVTASPTDF